MNIVSFCGVGICGVLLCVLLRRENQEIAIMASIACGISLIFMILPQIKSISDFFETLFDSSNVSNECWAIMLKSLGIAYLTQFSADLCRDTGHGSIAAKIELGGKIAILASAIPVFRQLLDVIIKITDG